MDEQIAFDIEGQVVGVAEPSGNQLEFLAGWVRTHDHPARCGTPSGVASGVLIAWLEQVSLVVVAIGAFRCEHTLYVGVIAEHQV